MCRIFHDERLVTYRTLDGKWREGDIAATQKHLRPMASAQAEMMLRRGRQKKAKCQKVTAEIGCCPLGLTYDANVRREGEEEEVRQEIWLGEVRIPPVVGTQSSVYLKYRKREAIDFPLVAVAVRMDSESKGICTECKVVLNAVGSSPLEVVRARRKTGTVDLSPRDSFEACAMSEAICSTAVCIGSSCSL